MPLRERGSRRKVLGALTATGLVALGLGLQGCGGGGTTTPVPQTTPWPTIPPPKPPGPTPAPLFRTHCDGDVHLPAGHHTLFLGNNASSRIVCTIVGEPGAVIDSVECDPCFCDKLVLKGSLLLNGTGRHCLFMHLPVVEVHGNVSIQDCLNMAIKDFYIIGPTVPGEMVSVKDSTMMSYWSHNSITVTNNANVIFSGFEAPSSGDASVSLTVENSRAIFESAYARAEASSEGYTFTNSTIIATNTSFDGGHNFFYASNSVLNLTNSFVNIERSDFNSGIRFGNCSLDVTCVDPGPVFHVGLDGPVSPDAGIVFSDSMVHFKNCSCAGGGPVFIDESNPVVIKGGSMTYSSCPRYGGAAKANRVVVV